VRFLTLGLFSVYGQVWLDGLGN